MAWGDYISWGCGLAGASPRSGVVLTRDATSNKVVPASASEWASIRSLAGVTAGACTHIWQMQEASGNLADSIGSNTLTAFSTPLYQQTITGWTRKAIRLDGTGDAFFSADAGIGNTATTSHLVFAYIALAGSQAAALATINVGNGASVADRRQLFINTSSALSVRGNGGQATADGAVSMGTTVHPVWLIINRASTTLAAISDGEVVTTTLTLPSSGTSAYFSFEGQNNAFVLYAALFEGAAAEVTTANCQAMNTQLGW